MKYSGKFGFVTTEETDTDIYTEVAVERNYKGDIYNVSYRNKQTNYANDDHTVSLEISVVADLFLKNNLGRLKYITYRGDKWKVDTFNPLSYPRVTITVGGLYYGE